MMYQRAKKRKEGSWIVDLYFTCNSTGIRKIHDLFPPLIIDTRAREECCAQKTGNPKLVNKQQRQRKQKQKQSVREREKEKENRTCV